MHIYIYIGPEETKGVPRNGGRKSQSARSRLALNSLRVQTLLLTDVQTPFLRTPSAPITFGVAGRLLTGGSSRTGCRTSAAPWPCPRAARACAVAGGLVVHFGHVVCGICAL